MRAPSASSISVVVPTYNDVDHLGAALESIVAQTLAPGEIVVADDGSDDGTEELVDSFVERYAAVMPIRYVRLATRSGVVAARTEGIAHARGAWIANCDSDDTWLPTKLERQVELLRSWSGERRLVLLGTFGYNVNEAEEIISEAPIGPSSEEDFEQTRRRGGRVVVMHSSVLYSRADYLAVGGYTTEYGTADDGDFFGKMAELGVVMCVPEPLITYRKRAGSIQVAQFWEKQQSAMHLRLNLRRRAKGEPAISREQFDAQLAAEPLRKRLRRRRLWLGAYYNRVGGMNFVNGRRVTGAWQLALAATMDNSRVRHGLRRYLRARSRA